MQLVDFDYDLPEDRIAQEPAPERAAARLLCLDRARPALTHARVAQLPGLLRAGDLVVLNETRVIPARVHARRPSGGRLEVLLVRPLEAPCEWEALVRGAPRVGERVHFPGARGEWIAGLGDGRWRVRLELEPADGSVLGWLERVGEVPLPPYVRRPAGPTAADRDRYQTTYARVPGAVAAPTAGLHLTPALLDAFGEHGVALARLTLHVGPGTFMPIRVGTLGEHVMAAEPYDVPAATAAAVGGARARGGRVVAVGTTTVRALESASAGGELVAGPGQADLFIRPGHRFRAVDVLLTNFHLPRSPLLALVSAFAGWERVRAAYDEAVRLGYRFYSFGDAMLIT